MGIKVTVVTLYDDSLSEHYVAVVHGELKEEERRKLAESLSARLPEDLDREGSDYEDERVLYFREVETCDSAADVSDLPNVDGRAT